jgi:hypothetical protein
MERLMAKLRVCAILLLAASPPVHAQVTSINSSTPASKGQDLNKIVCEVDQTTGSRLGAHKVCKTVLEWQQQRSEHRETVENFQRMNTSTGCQEGQGC